MALTFQDYTANGTAVSFAIPFDRIRDIHVKVFYGATEVTTGWSVAGNNVVFTSPPPNGTVVRVRRITDFTERLVDYVDGSRLNEVDLDTDSKQAFYLIQESRDINDVSMVKNSLGNWEAGFARIQSVSYPVENNDAANKLYVDQTANNFATYGIAAPTTRWAFTGNGTSFIYPITGATLIASTYYLVTINGVVSDPNVYTVSPDTLTFDTPPSNGSAVVVVLLGYPRMTVENTVGTVSLQNGAVTSDKMASTLDLSSKTLTLPNESVTAGKIASGAVTDDNISSGVSASKLTTGTLPADRIGSNAITTDRLNNSAVTASKLDGQQTGTAPIYGCRAWVNFDGNFTAVTGNSYSRTGTTVVVTKTTHGLQTGNKLSISSATDIGLNTATATTASVEITVINANSFSFQTTAVGTATGTLTYARGIRQSGNIASVARNGTSGDFTLTFATAMPNTSYAVYGTEMATGTATNALIVYELDAGNRTTSSCRIAVGDNQIDQFLIPSFGVCVQIIA